MPNKNIQHVFISSTSQDLKEYREAVDQTLRQMGFAVIKMEDFSAKGASAVDTCLQEVDRADIYIGIFAHRYGFIPDGYEISITEIEFNRALENKIPCLCFLIDEETGWPLKFIEEGDGKSKLATFKGKIDSRVVRKTFSSPDDLALKVSIAVNNLYSNASHPPDSGNTPDVIVFANHEKVQAYLDSYMNTTPVKRTKIIVLSGGTALRGVVQRLLQGNTQVEVLIQHPDVKTSEIVINRIIDSVNFIRETLPTKVDVSGLKVNLYRNNAAYRAILFDNSLLCVSWFTYHNTAAKVEGHPHPHIVLHGPSQAFNDCKGMFDYVFSSLLEKSEPLEHYIQNNPR